MACHDPSAVPLLSILRIVLPAVYFPPIVVTTYKHFIYKGPFTSIRVKCIENMYNNPVIPGFNPDPSIIRVDNDYFLVTSSFEYFPGAPIYHSSDLIRWTLIGHALTRPSQIQIHTPEPGGGVWATTLRYHDGVFYITAASFARYRPQQDDRVWPRGFYVKTTNIWNSDSWSDAVYFDELGFDQDVSSVTVIIHCVY